MALRKIFQSCLLSLLLVAVADAEEVFNTTPPTVRTRFSCHNRPMGFYADIEADCRVYHTCDDHGNKFTYRCPEETAFRQDAMICDHAHLVDCRATVYPSTHLPDGDVDEGLSGSSTTSPDASNSLDDPRMSFSRSFRVVQRPDVSVPNKLQSGFVFRASLFLRNQNQNQNRNRGEPATDTCATCDVDSRATASTARPFAKFDSRRNEPAAPRRSFSEVGDRNAVQHFTRSPENNQRSPFVMPPSGHRDVRPYLETLRSIQAHAGHLKSTTEIPVHALTVSLKPLVPNELEYDPYYPKQPTSTEAYYTPSSRNKPDTFRFSSSSQTPVIATHRNLAFEIPPMLPDLNSLEDLVDRRKFFYIPRTNVKSISRVFGV
ncbi:hypothetical protein PUN28_001016 [Cardiocondyla obscurior]|uniref:Chitin-binding type-2 domain-containing protein n=1 Tax=Cardiocondyla obscurior TaxID=286306 RepID=A0AAW2H2Y0_9HYME